MKIRKGRSKKERRTRLITGMALLLVLLLGAAAGVYAWRAQTAESRSNTDAASARQGQADEEEQSDGEQTGKEESETAGSQGNEDLAEKLCQSLTLEEKAAQMFIVTPDVLAGQEGTQTITADLKTAYEQRPVGGFVLMGANIDTPEQVTEFNRDLRSLSEKRLGVQPFLCVDEEGGSVCRVAANPNFPVKDVGDMRRIGEGGDSRKAREAGSYIGKYLREYGFNVDFAPVADVLENPSNTVVKDRAFGGDPELVAEMAEAFIRGLHSQEILASVKHFPGHGATTEDSHEGLAYSKATMDELRERALIPFEKGMEARTDFVMVGHIAFPNVLDEDVPASMSKYFIQDVLRGELGFDGLVITDAMNMGAVAQRYEAGEAAVSAIEAGVDLVLMPEEFERAYQAVIEAVESGRLEEEQLDRSVERILRCKLESDRTE